MDLFQNRKSGPLVPNIVAWFLITTGALPGADAPAPRGEPAGIEAARRAFVKRMENLANQNPEALEAIFRQGYGRRLSEAVLDDWMARAKQGKISLPDRFVMLDSALPEGARAAYSAEAGGTVFLRPDLCDSPDVLIELVAEECGHHFDSLLGPGDAPGDEGEIFRLGLSQGMALRPIQRQLLAWQSDQAMIQYEGRDLPVEMGFFKSAGKAIKKTATQTVPKVVTNTIPKAVVKAKTATVKTGAKIGEAWADAGVAAAESAVSAGNNFGEAAAKTSKGTEYAIRATAAAVNGDDDRARELIGQSKSQFEQAGDQAVKGFVDVVDVVASAGDAYNETVGAMDQLVPGLGVAFDIGLGVVFPYSYVAIAAVRGTADVRSAYNEGGTKAALIAGSYATLDVGVSALGIKSKQLGAAKELKYWRTARGKDLAKSSRYIDEAWDGGRLASATAKPGRMTRFKNYVSSIPGARSLENLAIRKFRPPNLAPKVALGQSKKYLALTGVTKVLTGVKFGIPGRDRRDSDGALLGTGGNTYSKALPSGIDLSSFGADPIRPMLPFSESPLFGVHTGGQYSAQSVLQGRQLSPGGGLFGPFVKGPPPPVERTVTTPTVVSKPSPTPLPPAVPPPPPPPPPGGGGMP